VFNKAAKSDLGSESSPGSRKSKAASLIGPDLVFEGRLSGTGEAHIEGRVIGTVRLGRLTIGESGYIEGSIEAEYLDVRGRVSGSIQALSVRIAASAHVEADITHQQLSMEAGAFFQGRCMQVSDFSTARPHLIEAPAAPAPETEAEAEAEAAE
jgi:cytoskeletal protein CcmA (bactofilin family)